MNQEEVRQILEDWRAYEKSSFRNEDFDSNLRFVASALGSSKEKAMELVAHLMSSRWTGEGFDEESKSSTARQTFSLFKAAATPVQRTFATVAEELIQAIKNSQDKAEIAAAARKLAERSRSRITSERQEVADALRAELGAEANVARTPFGKRMIEEMPNEDQSLIGDLTRFMNKLDDSGRVAGWAPALSDIAGGSHMIEGANRGFPEAIDAFTEVINNKKSGFWTGGDLAISMGEVREAEFTEALRKSPKIEGSEHKNIIAKFRLNKKLFERKQKSADGIIAGIKTVFGAGAPTVLERLRAAWGVGKGLKDLVFTFPKIAATLAIGAPVTGGAAWLVYKFYKAVSGTPAAPAPAGVSGESPTGTPGGAQATLANRFVGMNLAEIVKEIISE